MEWVRKSFGRGAKKKRKAPDFTNVSSVPPYVHISSPEQAIKNLEELSVFTKTLSRDIAKKRKKDKRGEQIPKDHGKDYEKFESYIDAIKRCFYIPPPSVSYEEEPNIDNRYDSMRQEDDDHGGFRRSRSVPPSSRKHNVAVHYTGKQEPPIADYTLEPPNKRDVQASRKPNRPESNDRQIRRAISVDDSKRNRNINNDNTRQLQEELRVRQEANERAHEEIKRLKEDLKKCQREYDAEKRTREDAQNRLSEMMGKQLKTNNPAITDLSDPDRPLNLVDKFSNIYDNEWTDTIEEIEKIAGDESTATKILLTLVTDTYTECYNLRHKGNVWLQLEDRITSVRQKVNGVPEDMKNELKQMKVEQLQSLKQAILNKMYAEVDRKVLTCLTKSKKQYLDKCLEVCWMMVCHSPPLHLEWNYKGHSFDLQILKPFTESGNMVDFVVWPVTFLHKDGPLLCKGVAQGAISSQVVSAKSRQTHF